METDSQDGEEGSCPRLPTVALIGGGFSGAMTAVQLLRRRHPGGLRIVLIERRHAAGRGIAYSTTRPVHRLNVTAGQMGALPREPEHFLRWVNEREPGACSDSFFPRSLYGSYLEDVLDEAVRRSAPGNRFVLLRDEVLGLSLTKPGCAEAQIALASGATVSADWVVLATGHASPADPPWVDDELLADGCYVRDPWDSDPVLADPQRAQPVILLGSGLTMVDVALALAQTTAASRLYAISRHGLLPRAHRPLAPAQLTIRPTEDARAVLAQVMLEVTAASQGGQDWRGVVDSLRPVTNTVWAGFSEVQRRWFIAHLARLWEVHRHRMAPEVAGALGALRATGRLRISAAEVLDVSRTRRGVAVRLGPPRGAGVTMIEAARIINCTGPDGDITRHRDPLMGALLRRGLARPDPLRLGVDVDDCGALLDRAGRPSRVLFAIGPLRKGRLWETTAVPEIRAQAEALAETIAQMSADTTRLVSIGGHSRSREPTFSARANDLLEAWTA